VHPGRKTDLVDFLFLLGYSLGRGCEGRGGLEIVKESFSLSPLSRLSCYEGNGLYKGSGCKLRSYEILGYRKTWKGKRGGRDLRLTLIPSQGLGRDVRTVIRKKSV